MMLVVLIMFMSVRQQTAGWVFDHKIVLKFKYAIKPVSVQTCTVPLKRSNLYKQDYFQSVIADLKPIVGLYPVYTTQNNRAGTV